MIGALVFVGMFPSAYSQTTVFMDIEPGAGFGVNTTFLWNTTFADNWTTDATGTAVTVTWSNTTPANNAVLGTGSGTGTYSAFLGENIRVGTISVVNGSWTIALGANTLTIDSASSFSTGVTISGSGSVVKSGTGTATLSSNNNYSGGTTINAGALRFTATNTVLGPVTVNSGGTLQLGASSVLPAGSAITLAGGSLALMGAFNQTVTPGLAMSAGSTIDFGSGFGASALVFGDSSGLTWTGTLLVSNFSTAGGDTLRFGTNNTALTSGQLASISFDGIAAQIDASGFVTPVPEPEAFASVLGAASLAWWVWRRRQRGLASAAT